MKKLIAFATMALSVVAFAAGKDGPKKHVPRGGNDLVADPVVRLVTNPKMAEKIGLTDEQRKQIREIGKESRKGMDDMRRQLDDSMKRQAELLKAEKVDEPAVMAEIDKAFDLRKEMAKCQTKRVIQIKAILTAEQVEKALKEVENLPKRGKSKEGGKGEKDGKDKDVGKDNDGCPMTPKS